MRSTSASCSPSSSFLFLVAVGTTREHLGFALALGVPIFAVVSKADACRPAQLERSLRQLERVVKAPGCKKIPFRVATDDDAITAAANFITQS